MKTVYSMSSAGGCPRVLSAQQLEYEPTPKTKSDLDRLEYYTMLEEITIRQLETAGYSVEREGYCSSCDRYGIHIEMENILLDLKGHLDGRLWIDKVYMGPLEIKSLGPASWRNFKNNQFNSFHEYAFQIVCYMEHEQKPGFYRVLNRDTGEPLSYVIGSETDIVINGITWAAIPELPVIYEEVVDKLNLVETYVQADELAPKDPENHNCWFCDYRYLCKDISEIQPGETIDVPEYINVALDRYSWAKEQENLVTQIKSDAAKEMVDFCKQKQVPKFQAEGYSISYRGQKTKMTLDSKGLKAKHPVIYAEFAKESNPFDDYSIRPRGK